MKSLLLSVSCLLILGCGLLPAPEAIMHGCIPPPDFAPVDLDFTPYLPNILSDLVQGASEDVANRMVITNVNISDQINDLSCSTREVAVHATAALLYVGTHTVVTIKDTNHGVVGVGLSITVNTDRNVFQLTYRHQTEPHTETIPFKKDLRLQRWQQLIFVLSGTQFLFILECEVVLSTTIAVPDFCFSSSSTIFMGDVSSKQPSIVFRDNKNDVGIIFGNRGYMDICPNLKYDCPTCAESLSLQQKIRELERELEQKMDKIQTLQSQLDEPKGHGDISRFMTLEFFEEFRNSDFVMRILRDSPSIAAGGDGNEDKCYLNGILIDNGRFFTHSFPNKIDASCMCFFGVILCDKEVQRFQRVYYVCEENSLPANTYAVEKLGNNFCRLKGCGDIGSRVNQDAFTIYRCGNTNSSQCLPLRNSKQESDRLKYRKMVCCGDCDPCEDHPCPAIASCEANPTYGNHTCVCPEGMYHTGDQCSRLFRCLNISTCPENSVCMEDKFKIGHFCDCTNKNTTPGFRWNETTNTCEDVDECSEGSVKCPLLSKCENQQGSYRCVCQDGYKKNELTGKCEIHCDPECRNGGVCLPGNVCVCSGFTGLQCERDINECTQSVCGENESCVNTLGSYYCACKPGFVRNGEKCENINECNSESLNTCVKDSKCEDTPGGFTCKCRKVAVWEDCTGWCKFRNQDIPNGDSYTAGNCKRCTCVNGVGVCGETTCDCTNPKVRKSDKCCKSICRLEQGCELPDGSRLERTKATHTKDGCQMCTCSANGELSCIRKSCPDISYCPRNLTIHPEGACCPVCKVPKCVNDNTVEHIDNGCTKCLCKDSQWTCEPPVKCLELECDEEDTVYQSGQCCPSCRVLPSPSTAECK